MLQLCESCIKQNVARRERLKGQILVDKDPRSNPFLFTFQHSLQLQAIAIAGLAVLVSIPTFFGVLALKGDVIDWFLLSTVVTTSFVSMITSIFFGLSLLFMEPLWGIGCLVIPVFIYRYVFLHWDDAKCLFLFNIASTILLYVSFAIWLERTSMLHPFIDFARRVQADMVAVPKTPKQRGQPITAPAFKRLSDQL
jgi:hypothetical protein